VLYSVDEKRNPISLIKEIKRTPTSCTVQYKDYYCVIVTVDNTIVYSSYDKPVIPDYVKRIRAPKAPTDKEAIQVFVDGDILAQKQAPFIENNRFCESSNGT
jgi:archaellum component FlaG (FlaF/FlaG flagellin family)